MATTITSCSTNPEKAIDLSNLDTSVNPAEDFDNYANGGWKEKNPIPDDKSRFGTFDKLRDEAEVQVKTLFEEIITSEHEAGSNGQKIADLYNSGMDTNTIEGLGYQPIAPLLEEIEGINSKDEIQAFINKSHATGNSILFGFYGSADRKNSDFVIAHFSQSGLGLSDRDYYLENDSRSKEIRTKYVEHIAKMFELINTPSDDAKEFADRIMAFETRLAKASLTRVELRDPEKTYNKTNLQGLADMAPNYNWDAFFKTIDVDPSGDINVGMPEFMKATSEMLEDVSLEDWKLYIKWDILSSSASYLSSDFVDQSFDFYGKTMKDQKEIRARWKRVQGLTNSVLDEAIGQLYVAKYFPPEAKERMIKLVDNLQLALKDRIKGLDWMSDATKEKALEKLATTNTKIGYPDKWKDFSSLEISADSYFNNILNARAFGKRENLDKINKPVDKEEWFMSPQTVNAYYNPLFNEIVFPAAILQPPFFYLDADDAVNYGAIGVVIGHEMTHGFDDKGCKYDKDGNMNNWWTEEDGEKFEKRTKVLVDQYNEFQISDSVFADGTLSLGENIADLGGVNIAFQAFQEGGKKTEPISGFTSEQRFFLSYAHLWANNTREKEMQRLTKEDVHSLGRFRVLGPLRNVPEFYAAFNVEPGNYMYLPKEERAAIW